MRSTLGIAVFVAAAGLTGCAPAVAIHPFYTNHDLVSDLLLPGVWSSNDGQIWRVKAVQDGYDVTQTPEPGAAVSGEFNVHLARLDECEFVDVTSKADVGIGVPGHLIGKVRFEAGKLFVSALNETWLKHMIETGAGPASIIGESQQLVLTAPTSELQVFLRLHCGDPAAWDEDDEGLQRLH